MKENRNILYNELKNYRTKYHYLAITVKENNKYYSYVLREPESNNLLNTLKIKNIITCNIYNTKRQANQIVEYWNESYKENGTYLFN